MCPRPSIALVVIVSGACAYRPGSFEGHHGTFPGERAIVGCLDVAVARAPHDVAATGEVIELNFGNHCEQPVTVDIGAIRAHGQGPDGRGEPLVPEDPAGEIRPLELDGLWNGREVIEYRLASRPAERVAGSCFDVGGLDASAIRREAWICLPPQGER